MLLASCERADQRPNGWHYCMYPGRGRCSRGPIEWKVRVSIGGRMKTFYCCPYHARRLASRAACRASLMVEIDADENKAERFAHTAELAV